MRRTAGGAPLITPECMTVSEIEYQVERLKAELDQIKTKASENSLTITRRSPLALTQIKLTHYLLFGREY